MKIAAIKTYRLGGADGQDGSARVKPFLFVKVETDAGFAAWGEAYALAGRERAIEEMILALAGGLLGREAASPRSFRAEALHGFADKRAGIDFYCALSALGLALWDLAGKRLDAPCATGSRSTPTPGASGPRRSPTPSRAEGMARDGVGAIKVYPLQFPDLDRAEACLREVRAAVGRDVEILIDLNAPDDPHLALEAARRQHDSLSKV